MTGTDREKTEDELLAELRRANPVDVDALASPADPAPAQLLEEVLADTGDAPPPLLAVRGANGTPPAAVPARRRWISAAAAAAVIALVAVATIVVYDSGTGRDATAAVHQAVEATIRVSDSATSSTTVTYDLDELAEPWAMTIEAIFSDGNTGFAVMTGPAVPELGIPELGSYAEIVIGDTAFRSVANEPWEGPTSLPAGASGPGAAILSNLTFGVTIEDLGDLYQFVDLGREDLDGIAMSHYRTHTTPAGAGAGFLMSFGRFLMMTDQEPAEQLDRVQLDVWVDSDDLIRRVSYSAVMDGIGSFSVVTDWDDFGEAPPITAPVS